VSGRTHDTPRLLGTNAPSLALGALLVFAALAAAGCDALKLTPSGFYCEESWGTSLNPPEGVPFQVVPAGKPAATEWSCATKRKGGHFWCHKSQPCYWLRWWKGRPWTISKPGKLWPGEFALLEADELIMNVWFTNKADAKAFFDEYDARRPHASR
jgi:hypothetical protein